MVSPSVPDATTDLAAPSAAEALVEDTDVAGEPALPDVPDSIVSHADSRMIPQRIDKKPVARHDVIVSPSLFQGAHCSLAGTKKASLCQPALFVRVRRIRPVAVTEQRVPRESPSERARGAAGTDTLPRVRAWCLSRSGLGQA